MDLGRGNQPGFLRALACTAWLLAGSTAAPAAEPPAGHITGIGGIFFKSKDPKALTAWYRDVLGLPLESWGGAALRYDAPAHPQVLVWSVFAQSESYFNPSTREFMINYAVDDLDAMLAKLKAKGVVPLKRDDQDPNGRFAWIMDPDGSKLELWEPKREKTAKP